VRVWPATWDEGDGRELAGEFVSICERVVVASDWGRIHEQIVGQGERVGEGTILGALREGEHVFPVIAPVRAIFLGWLVREGERVEPGAPLAVVRVEEED
jgi:hypothetical protein